MTFTCKFTQLVKDENHTVAYLLSRAESSEFGMRKNRTCSHYMKMWVQVLVLGGLDVDLDHPAMCPPHDPASQQCAQLDDTPAWSV